METNSRERALRLGMSVTLSNVGWTDNGIGEVVSVYYETPVALGRVAVYNDNPMAVPERLLSVEVRWPAGPTAAPPLIEEVTVDVDHDVAAVAAARGLRFWDIVVAALGRRWSEKAVRAEIARFLLDSESAVLHGVCL